jgi:uncharacterized membrane protein
MNGSGWKSICGGESFRTLLGEKGASPMALIERSIEIDSPVEKVFRFAADWRNWDKFFVGVSDFKPLTETTRGSGAKFSYKASLLGVPVPVETHIRDFEENRGWTGVCGKGLEHLTQWTFVEAAGKTKFTYALRYQIPIPVVGSLLDTLFIRRQWERIIRQSLANLKTRLER